MRTVIPTPTERVLQRAVAPKKKVSRKRSTIARTRNSRSRLTLSDTPGTSCSNFSRSRRDLLRCSPHTSEKCPPRQRRRPTARMRSRYVTVVSSLLACSRSDVSKGRFRDRSPHGGSSYCQCPGRCKYFDVHWSRCSHEGCSWCIRFHSISRWWSNSTTNSSHFMQKAPTTRTLPKFVVRRCARAL